MTWMLSAGLNLNLSSRRTVRQVYAELFGSREGWYVSVCVRSFVGKLLLVASPQINMEPTCGPGVPKRRLQIAVFDGNQKGRHVGGSPA